MDGGFSTGLGVVVPSINCEVDIATIAVVSIVMMIKARRFDPQNCGTSRLAPPSLDTSGDDDMRLIGGTS